MTSGSTGSPEFVRLSYENIYSNTVQKIYLNISSRDDSYYNFTNELFIWAFYNKYSLFKF